MKLRNLLAMAFVALLAVGCSDDEEGTNPGVQGEKTVEVITADYSNWNYVNLKTGEICGAATVPGPWKYLDADKNVKSEKDPEMKGEVPAEWDLAFHYYEIKTNDGEAVAVNAKSLEEVKSVPTAGFTKDVKVTAEDQIFTVDMAQMQKGQVGYAGGLHNPVLYDWVTRTPTGSMPPILYDVDKTKIFIVKLKNGDCYKLKFLDRLDATGKKKLVKFSYSKMDK